jgi:hypothetical protein
MASEGLMVDFCIFFCDGKNVLSDVDEEVVAVARCFIFFKACLGVEVVLFTLECTWYFFLIPTSVYWDNITYVGQH